MRQRFARPLSGQQHFPPAGVTTLPPLRIVQKNPEAAPPLPNLELSTHQFFSVHFGFTCSALHLDISRTYAPSKKNLSCQGCTITLTISKFVPALVILNCFFQDHVQCGLLMSEFRPYSSCCRMCHIVPFFALKSSIQLCAIKATSFVIPQRYQFPDLLPISYALFFSGRGYAQEPDLRRFSRRARGEEEARLQSVLRVPGNQASAGRLHRRKGRGELPRPDRGA